MMTVIVVMIMMMTRSVQVGIERERVSMERRKRLGEIKPMSRADKIVSKWGNGGKGKAG